MKKLFVIILSVVILCSSAYAQEITNDNIYTLSLSEAINLAKTNNPQISVIETKMIAADIALNAAKLNQKDVKNVPVTFGDTHTPLVKKGYYVEAANTNIFLLPIELKQVESKIAYDVTEKYYNLILTKKLCDISDNTLSLAKENLDVINKYYELGMVAQLDVKTAEANVRKAEYTKNSYLRNHNLAKENLKISLNIDDECDFVLTDTIVTNDYIGDVEKEIEAALNTRYDVTSLKANYDLSKLNFDIVSIYNLPNTANYNNAKSDFLQTEYNYNNNKRLIKLSMENTYNNILTTKDNLSSATNDFEIKQLEYEIAKINYEVGSITNAQLMQAQNALSQAEISLENAKLSYLLAVEKYKYEISIGL